jgi:ABC-type sugar transport system ATPase subunit
MATESGGHSPLLSMQNIGKKFSGTTALDSVFLDISAGEVHALVGENGAGKSTLGKVMGGSLRPDTGQILVYGKPVQLSKPADALNLGIAVMEQEITLAPDLTVMENVLLGLEPSKLGFTDRSEMKSHFLVSLNESGFELHPDAPVGELSLAHQQQVEILRALSRKARLLLMDEPTAALQASDAKRLHEIIRRLSRSGVSVVLVSHFLEEVLELSDRVSVLRGGKNAGSHKAATTSVSELIECMLGEALTHNYPTIPRPATDSPVAFSATEATSGTTLRGIDVSVRRGEVIGLFGLVGSGRSEFAQAIFGADPHVQGRFTLNGEEYKPTSPERALQQGLSLLPESRKDQGLFLELGQRENTTMSSTTLFQKLGYVDKQAEQRQATTALRRFGVDRISLEDPVRNLSGGNQQKVLFAKCLMREPKVLILDEPTRGVDVGARRSIYDSIAEMAATGMAVIVISSDVDEVSNLAHRLYVIRQGSVVAELDQQEFGHDKILNLAFGLGLPHDPHSPDTSSDLLTQHASS